MNVMNRTVWVWVIGLGVTLLWSGVVFEARPGLRLDHSAEAQSRRTSASTSLPKYVPPTLSAPTGLRGGGTRGIVAKLLSIAALAPEHVGLTMEAQPALYWYLSQATSLPVELTITQLRAIDPLFETRLPSPLLPGIQRVKLADYDIRLTPGVAYHWYVSVIYDLEQRSRDVITSGAIQLREAPQALRLRLSEADKSATPHIYAEAGFWYDAISAISELIDAAPHNLELRQQRAALLEQVYLPEVADYDRATKEPQRRKKQE